MIFNHLMEVYLMIWLSAALHELAHYFVAKMIKLEVLSVHIGDELFSVHIGKVYISFMLRICSCVEFYADEMKEKSRWQRAVFFLSGPAMNLMISAIAAPFSSNLYMKYLLWINLLLFAVNAFPWILKQNDMGKARLYLKK